MSRTVERVITVAVFWMLQAMLSTAMAGPLKADENVIFIQDFARELDGNAVEVNIQAWVYEPERRRGLSALFSRYLDVNLDELSAPEQELFAQRTHLFKTDSERGKSVPVLLAGKRIELPPTDAAGRSHTRVLLQYPQGVRPPHLIRFTVDGDMDFGHAQVQGVSEVIAREGISVVSDIDDTVKVSEVLDREQLMRKTFLQPFTPVPGMAEWYSQLAADGAVFHYLTSSPVQLYPALVDFLEGSGFPRGSMHMRESTSWKTLIPGSDDSQRHKRANLERLLKAFPLRTFILVGDSGEADPEIYADFARRYPEQVIAIHIRDVTGEDRHAPRYQHVFRQVPAERWQVFSEPSF